MKQFIEKIKYVKLILFANENMDIGSFRLKRMWMATLSGLTNKAINSIVGLLSIPMTLNYLGTERYSFMITLVTILSLVTYSDLGLGFGLQNRIPVLKQDIDKLKKAISSTFFFLCTVTLVASLIIWALYYFIDWRKTFSVSESITSNELTNSIIAFFVCLLGVIPFSFVQRVQVGFQEGYVNEIWGSFGSIFSLIFLFISVFLKAEIPWIILSLYGTPTLFTILNFIYHFFLKKSDLLPRISFLDKTILLSLIKDGLVFFSVSLMYTLATSYDNLLIAHFLGAEAVVLYSIGYRLCGLASTPLYIYSSSVLPAFNDAIVNGDKEWARKMLKKSIKYVLLISILLATIIFFCLNPIIHLWIGKQYTFSTSICLSFAVFIIYYGVHGLCSHIMLSSYFINWLLKIFPISFICVLCLKLILIPIWKIDGLIWATMFGFFITFHFVSYMKLKSNKFI